MNITFFDTLISAAIISIPMLLAVLVSAAYEHWQEKQVK